MACIAVAMASQAEAGVLSQGVACCFVVRRGTTVAPARSAVGKRQGNRGLFLNDVVQLIFVLAEYLACAPGSRLKLAQQPPTLVW
jgi:hypothetical protein